MPGDNKQTLAYFFNQHHGLEGGGQGVTHPILGKLVGLLRKRAKKVCLGILRSSRFDSF